MGKELSCAPGHGQGFGPAEFSWKCHWETEVSGRAEVPGQGEHSGDGGCWSRAEPAPRSRGYRV